MPLFTRGRRVLPSVACVLAAAGIAVGVATRPLAAQPPAEKPVSTVVAALERANLDRVLVAPKDKALRDALHMLPARLAELPGEIDAGGGDAPPAALMELLPRLAGAPVRVGLSYDPSKPTGGFAGVGVVLSFGASGEAEAAKTAGLVASLLRDSAGAPEPRPSKAFPGMSEITAPPGQVRFGPRQSGGTWAFEVHVGTVPDADAALQTLDGVSAAGVQAFIRGRFDAAPLTPLIGMLQVLAAANPAAAAMVNKLTEGGFIGPECAKAEFVLGHTPEATVGQFAYRGLGERAEKAGVSRVALTAADLAAIPADCYWAGVGTSSVKYLRTEIDNALVATPMGKDLLAKFREHTGVDPLDDVLGALGGTWGVYMADALGGPNLGGIVAVASLADADGFVRATAKLAATANALLSEQGEGKPNGYVSLRAWSEPSTKGRYTSLRFPGLPVPLEITYAVAGKWLVLGGTPQAAVAAVRHIESGGKGLGVHAGVADVLARIRSATSVSVIDSGRTIRHGYPIVSLLGSAVGNVVRSRGDGAAGREPGLIVPAYSDLVQGARAMVQVTYWDGADLIARWEGDKSLLVNMAGTIGAAAPIMPFIPALAAAAAFKAQEMNGHHEHHEEDEGEEGAMDEGGHKPNFNLVPR